MMSKWIVSLPDSRVVFDNRGEAEEYVEEWIDSDDHELTAEYEQESEQTEWMWLIEVHPYDSRHRQETITLHEAEYHEDGRSGVLEEKYEILRADRNKLRKVARRRQEQLLKAPLAIEESLQDPNTLYQICEAHYEPLSDEMPDKFEDTRYAHYLEEERSRTSTGVTTLPCRQSTNRPTTSGCSSPHPSHVSQYFRISPRIG